MGRCSLPDKVTEEMAVELRLARVFLAGHTAVLLHRRLSAVRLRHTGHRRVVWRDQSVASTASGFPTRSIA